MSEREEPHPPGVTPPAGPAPRDIESGSPPPAGLESTTQLLLRIRRGDPRAREILMGRYLKSLQRFAHGRLPAAARDLMDTEDIVQVTLIRALEHVEGFEPRGPGSFHAYLRRAVLNQIRDQARRVARSPGHVEIPADLDSGERSPLEQAIGREALQLYEAALGRLTAEQQEAVILRLELGFTYEELAAALGSPTANAARMVATRALARIADLMREVREEGR